jgi:hypothetical protein
MLIQEERERTPGERELGLEALLTPGIG